jgi:hypothetical protein
MKFRKPGANPSRPARMSKLSPERLMRVPFCPHERVLQSGSAGLGFQKDGLRLLVAAASADTLVPYKIIDLRTFQNVTAHRASSIAPRMRAITNPILTNGSSVILQPRESA